MRGRRRPQRRIRPARVITTTDGGATWSLSASAALSGVQQLMDVSCLPASGGGTTCYGAGITFASDSGTAESLVLASQDDGATWAQVESLTDNGWFNSISCASTRNCWAAGAGSTDALAGTSDGGSSWSTVTSDTTNDAGLSFLPERQLPAWPSRTTGCG